MFFVLGPVQQSAESETKPDGLLQLSRSKILRAFRGYQGGSQPSNADATTRIRNQ